jgi:hypothetical protein
MNYLKIFRQIATKPIKLDVKLGGEHSWIESGEHGQMNHYWRINFVSDMVVLDIDEFECRPYKVGVEMLEDDWEVYDE